MSGSSKFTIEVLYNGTTESISVQPHEQVTAVLARAENDFHITQNRHLYGLFLQNGTELNDQQSLEEAGVTPHQIVLLRQSTVRGGVR